MNRRQDEAYVLGASELGEADLIVTLLAENAGRVRGVARSARKSRRRFGGALEPLTRVRAEWTEREGHELHRIEALDLARSYAGMQSDPARQAACAVLAEIAGATTPEGQAEPRGFRLLGAVLQALEAGLDPWVAVRYFEYWTLRLHGVLPDLATCAACGATLSASDPRWVLDDGSLVCSACSRASGRGALALDRAEIRFLAAAARTAPEGMGAAGPTAGLGGALDRFLRGTLEGFAERSFRSYRHLAAAARTRAGGEKRP